MSFSLAIPYIKEKMALLGYVEHDDEFDLENIPSTKIDKTYSLQVESISASPASHIDFEWSMPMYLFVFLNGYSKPSEAMIDALDKASTITDEIFEVTDRYYASGIRSFKPLSLDFKKYAEDADHIIMIKIGIEATINIFNSKNC